MAGETEKERPSSCIVFLYIQLLMNVLYKCALSPLSRSESLRSYSPLQRVLSVHFQMWTCDFITYGYFLRPLVQIKQLFKNLKKLENGIIANKLKNPQNQTQW